ncbi:MAG: hypothetical protein U9N34_01175 [Candidatus Cloacimonadota bacterium]|nr:hypothetical protein [Candidatus Cloacimonadota bacterium]
MKNRLIISLAIILGLIIGYFVYPWVKCFSGACPLTSNRVAVTFLGGFFGYALSDLILGIIKKFEDNAKA